MPRFDNVNIKFPFLSLLISGGHTLLILCTDLGKYIQIACSMDDNIGEAIDKASVSLGFEYNMNMGPASSLVNSARMFLHDKHDLDIPILKSRIFESTLDFSFSGLKSALNRSITTITKNNSQRLNPDDQSYLAHLFLTKCSDILIRSIRKSSDFIPNLWGNNEIPILLGGGVARNDYIFDLYSLNNYINI